jgi:VanZ family protein
MRALALVTILICYGSLYPFDFTQPQAPAQASRSFLTHIQWLGSRADALGNLALFVPFGFFAVTSLAKRSAAFRGITTLVAAFGLAFTLQILQLYLPSRSAALGDVFWNMIGAAAGIALVQAVGLRSVSFAKWPGSIPGAIIALWLAFELIPFVPSLDWQEIKISVKPLLRAELSIGAFALHSAALLLAGEALQRLCKPKRVLPTLAAAATVVFVGKVLVYTQKVDWSLVAGLAVGYSTWLLVRSWPVTRRVALVAIVLMLAYAVAALSPFRLADAPRGFDWVPFAGLLRGSMLENTRALLASLLVFAGIAWLARDAGGSATAASIALAGLALILELAQMYVVSRSPGVTEPILALGAGVAVRVWPGSAHEGQRNPVPTHVRKLSQSASHDPPAVGWRRWILRVALASAAIAILIAIVIGLPGIPYNVAELFRAEGRFSVLLVFALTLLWAGAGPALISAWVCATPRRDWELPLLAFFAGLVSLALLWLSVTPESIDDIAGSNNLFWFVTNKDIWGSWARHAFLAIGSPGIIGFFERLVRYAALYGPVATFPAIIFLVLDARRAGVLSARRLAVWFTVSILWLWFCKGVAFDWSSTDNLNELIARDGFFGLGGGGYLYLLVALISANIVFLARMPIRPGAFTAGVAMTLLFLPCGWWLLTHGLEPQVHKYGSVFSGVQFLLGPDRQHHLSEQALFLRWSLVQLGGVLVASTGAWLARARPPVV